MPDFHVSKDAAKAAHRFLDTLKPEFESLASRYREAWGVSCALVDTQGHVVAGATKCSGQECTATRRHAVREALRWGEPFISLCPSGDVMWALPVMYNAVQIGGLVVDSVEVSHSEEDGLTPAKIRQAACDLLTMAEEFNLTNASLLQTRKTAARRESERAEAIHDLKGQSYQSIRDIYLVEEPALIAAIKRGDRSEARGIINRVLVGIYYLGRNRPKLLKSFLLELIVTMSRSAVEAGADPSELLGANYSIFTDLAHVETEEELCAWLVATLERIMDAIKANRQYPSSVLLGEAMKYMQERLNDDISRDEVAEVACLSPSHFSRIVKQTLGHSFTDLLARMRVERARELLTRSEMSLIQIGMECGFNDQSYFTKVFQKHTGQTPGEYRRSHRASFK
ncbi:MAG: helix-turn-helix domain-containing protein [Armatimonadota bacterium]